MHGDGQRRKRRKIRKAQPRRWGRIVNIASVRSFRPAEMHMIAYGVSKLGMHALTRAFAHNGAPFNITANTVCPGMVITENIDKRLTPEKYAEESAAIPLGRGATGEEIADAVLFPIRNGYVTGETININGGIVCTELRTSGGAHTADSFGIGTCYGNGGSVTINGGTIIAEASSSAISSGRGGSITIQVTCVEGQDYVEYNFCNV